MSFTKGPAFANGFLIAATGNLVVGGLMRQHLSKEKQRKTKFKPRIEPQHISTHVGSNGACKTTNTVYIYPDLAVFFFKTLILGA